MALQDASLTFYKTLPFSLSEKRWMPEPSEEITTFVSDLLNKQYGNN